MCAIPRCGPSGPCFSALLSEACEHLGWWGFLGKKSTGNFVNGQAHTRVHVSPHGRDGTNGVMRLVDLKPWIPVYVSSFCLKTCTSVFFQRCREETGGSPLTLQSHDASQTLLYKSTSQMCMALLRTSVHSLAWADTDTTPMCPKKYPTPCPFETLSLSRQEFHQRVSTHLQTLSTACLLRDT